MRNSHEHNCWSLFSIKFSINILEKVFSCEFCEIFENNFLITFFCFSQIELTWGFLFNRDLNYGCLVYMFSLRFSGSKFLINLRRQFRARKIFFVYIKYFVHIVFKIAIPKMRNLCCRLLFYQNLLINRLLTTAFVLVNGIVFSRSNGLIIQCLKACLMN